ncbi:MAG: PcfB family protein [Eubacteriales bacterium]|nr:PcfB family protein [Eubacteriales bacterium]
MQEEIEKKAVSFVISTSKLTIRGLLKGMHLYLRYRANRKAKAANEHVHGKQKVKALLRQDAGAVTVDIEKTELKGFERVARKYGIDYAVEKDHEKGEGYLIFFKAKDDAAVQSAYKEYAAMAFKKKDARESLKSRIERFTEKARSMFKESRVRNKKQERSR